ncbi:MAG: hypothetical protein ABSH44_19720 [Bryobacteraceae bacterium]|jgi:hypothetical protein
MRIDIAMGFFLPIPLVSDAAMEKTWFWLGREFMDAGPFRDCPLAMLAGIPGSGKPGRHGDDPGARLVPHPFTPPQSAAEWALHTSSRAITGPAATHRSQ